MQNQLGIFIKLNTTFEDALAKTTAALKTEGFGVLTEIDVKETMKKKLDVEMPAYKILGACNPPLAHRALGAAPEVGLLLPCNVTVREVEGGSVEVGLLNPTVMGTLIDNPGVSTVAAEALARLARVGSVLES